MIEILSLKIGDMDFSMFTQRFFKANLRIIFHKYTSSQRGGRIGLCTKSKKRRRTLILEGDMASSAEGNFLY